MARVLARSTAVPGDYWLHLAGEGLDLAARLRVTSGPGAGALELTLDPAWVRRGDRARLRVACPGCELREQVTRALVEGAPAGLTVRLVEVPGPTEATLEVTAGPGVPVGWYWLRLETGPQVARGRLWVGAAPAELGLTLWPPRLKQGASVSGVLSCLGCHMDETTTLSAEGLDVREFRVQGAERGSFTLAADQEAPAGSRRVLLRTAALGEEVEASVEVIRRRPGVVLDPDRLSVGWGRFRVRASARDTEFSPGGEVSELAGCGLEVLAAGAWAEGTDATALALDVATPLESAGRTCRLRFETTDGPQDATLLVEDRVAGLACPGRERVWVEAGRRSYLRTTLAAGRVVRIRTETEAPATLDPATFLLGPGGTEATPLAENDDESWAGTASLLVWPVRRDGAHVLGVWDRLGLRSGWATVDCTDWEPEVELEDETATGGTPGQALGGRVVRGELSGGEDHYDLAALVSALPPGGWVLQVLGRRVAPYEGAGAWTQLGLRQASGGLSWFEPGQGADPWVSDGQFPWFGGEAIVADWSEVGGSEGTYWLAVRPWAVINEVGHDELQDWAGGFVELVGEPGRRLGNCDLVGAVRRSSEPEEVFRVGLAGRSFDGSGYLVVCHDTSRPGCGWSDMEPDLAISDPAGGALAVGLALECSGQVVDAVCWRGTGLGWCEGLPAQTWSEGVIGRGFGLDRDDNRRDFLEQPEASPGWENARQVE